MSKLKYVPIGTDAVLVKPGDLLLPCWGAAPYLTRIFRRPDLEDVESKTVVEFYGDHKNELLAKTGLIGAYHVWWLTQLPPIIMDSVVEVMKYLE